MKMSGKVLAVIAGVVQMLSTFAFFVVILLQKVFKGMMSQDPDVLSVFSFPIAQTVQVLLLTCAVLLVVLGIFLKGRSFWAEILALVLIVFLCPLVARFGGMAETTFIGAKGVEKLISYSTLTGITAFPLMLSGMGSSLSMVAAGMSMCFKKNS